MARVCRGLSGVGWGWSEAELRAGTAGIYYCSPHSLSDGDGDPGVSGRRQTWIRGKMSLAAVKKKKGRSKQTGK